MRQSQKTEQADHLKKIGLEDQRQSEARSTASGESTIRSGISFKELVLDRDNLNTAYKRVYGNRGAEGIDGMSVYELLDYLKENKSQFLESLRDLSYKPSPVRRVEIPKPDGTKRKLGVPTVIDRLIQQAIAQAMTPVFEKAFSDNSFGFRPNRSAHDAIKRVTEFYDQGYHCVIDLDLKAYFDTVNHDLLMRFIKQYIDDEWLLRMIRKFLTSGVMDGQMFQKSEKGTPQGGNLSPLLANIYLNELDKLLTVRGHKFVRYADDCNIYVKSKRAGYRVLDSISKFLEKDLKLTVNQKKTKVGSPLRLKFLGFSLGVSSKGTYVRPCQQAKRRVKQSLKKITKRNRGRGLDELFKEINQKMVGWLNYYGIGKMKVFIKSLDEWLHSRIRQYIWKSWKKIKTRFKNLTKLGMTRTQARIFANTRKGYWRTAHSKTLLYTLTNEKLESLGLINMSKKLQSIQNA
ncbi:group II intron reverse transcriptase/maturase [Companilactobacillus hulinensis]|uniref:group II intron reverse transcriptase/maturase n=1 Tax=Companilactobacillus hulinensis TaxID=2486007 RepID=UPI000F78A99C|nr:group II intron reverse transcriptase/maturase [Companilactobacillus hulinensis]